MNELMAQITVGVVAGYNVDNSMAPTIDEVCKDLVYDGDRAQYYIPWLVIPARTVYKKEWGCPEDGEVVYVLQGTYNKKYNSDISVEQWKEHVMEHARYLKFHFNQSTVRVSFTESETEII